jgi:hypothetical protein
MAGCTDVELVDSEGSRLHELKALKELQHLDAHFSNCKT